MLVIHFLIGPSLLLLAIIAKRFPPKKINGLYGYRTDRSMKSQEAWDASNRYAFRLLLWVAVIVCVTQMVCYFLMSTANAVLCSCVVMTSLLIALIPITEKYLKDHFDHEGKPKTH